MLREASKRRLSIWLFAGLMLACGGSASALDLNSWDFNSCVSTYGLFVCKNYYCPQCREDKNKTNQWEGDQWEGNLFPPGQNRNDYSASVLPWSHEWAEGPQDDSGPPVSWSYKLPGSPGPAPGNPASGAPPPGPPEQPARNIVETGYAFLFEAKPEKPDYGLYSYLILADRSPIRAGKIIDDILNATPSAEALAVEPKRLNILYLPAKDDFDPRDRRVFHESDYNYDLAHRLLVKICLDPPAKLKDLCFGDLSRGPYIFSYAKAASSLAKLPPPLLFVDMSDLNERGFKTMLACYKAQVKRDDFSDQAKIDTLSNRLLSLILIATDWDSSIDVSVTKIVHTISDLAPKK